MTNTAARVIGPTLAGVAVAAVGEASAFFINGLTFLAFIVALMLMRPSARPHPARRQRIGAHLWEAVRYVTGQELVVVLISLIAVSAFLSQPYLTLLPVFAKDVLNTSAEPLLDFVCSTSQGLFDCQSPDALIYGLLTAANGFGAVIGTLFVASLAKKVQLGWWLTLGNLSLPILLIGFSLSRSFALSMVLLVSIGFSLVLQGTVANTLIQLKTADRLRGRVLSFYTLTLQGMRRLGGMQAGVIGDLFGVPVAVGVGSFLGLVYNVVIALRYPRVRMMASTVPRQDVPVEIDSEPE